MDQQAAVTKFHATAGHPIGRAPRLLDRGHAKLRLKWAREELDELEEAIDAGDIVAQYDAILDAKYFLTGTLVEMGLSDERGFAIVHGSNMAKFVDGQLLRDTEGKVQKPEGWVAPEPQLEALIREMVLEAEVARMAEMVSKRDSEAPLSHMIASELATLPAWAVGEVMQRAAVIRNSSPDAGLVGQLIGQGW